MRFSVYSVYSVVHKKFPKGFYNWLCNLKQNKKEEESL